MISTTRLSLLSALAVLGVSCGDKDVSNPDDSEDTAQPEDTGPWDLDGDGYDGTEDCDDDNPDVNPGATEVCDDIDNDCSGEADDDAVDAVTWYTDEDGDTYGDDETAVVSCDQPDGTVDQGGDCDDEDEAYNPGAVEDNCTDPNDYNCDGSVGYADNDGDGYAACEECNDGDKEISPDATEVCDDVDNDCDGKTDDEDDSLDKSTAAIWYEDIDHDQFGNADSTTLACDQPDGYVPDDTDCLDTNEDVNPGESEVYYNGLNDDCDADDDCDQDGDGEDVISEGSCTGGLDCDDTNKDWNTSATDVPQNGDDEDCDGEDAPYGVSDLSEGDLIITEFMPDPKNVNDSVGEWIEIYNNSGGHVDLDGLYIADDSGTASISGSLIFGDGDLVVLANSSSGDVTPDATYSGLSLNNSGDSIGLYESSSQNIRIDVIDYSDYDVNAGVSVNLSTDYIDPDLSDWIGHFCDSSSSWSGTSDKGSPGDTNEACSYTYTHDNDIQSIWNSYCTGCHGSSGGLSLSSAWGNIAGVDNKNGTHPLVAPWDVDAGYLPNKLRISTAISSGTQMPKSGGPMTSTELAKIETWIEEGAPK